MGSSPSKNPPQVAKPVPPVEKPKTPRPTTRSSPSKKSPVANPIAPVEKPKVKTRNAETQTTLKCAEWVEVPFETSLKESRTERNQRDVVTVDTTASLLQKEFPNVSDATSITSNGGGNGGGNVPPVKPIPSDSYKGHIFQAEEFAQLDSYAVEAPTEKCVSEMAELVNYLTHPPSYVPQSAESDEMSQVAKARVIYSWMTAQNLDTLDMTTEAAEGSPLWHLRNIKEETEASSGLYMAMCNEAGLTCEEVTGFVKDASYQPGEEIDATKKTTWNTVMIDGVWRLVDVKAASRHVIDNDGGDWIVVDGVSREAKDVATIDASLRSDYNEFYFLTDPPNFAYSHIPDDDKWQLLETKVTVDEFSEIAYLPPPFFDLGLRLSDRKSVLQTTDGEAELVIGLPEGDEQRSFVYELWESHETGKERKHLERYVCMEQTDGELRLKVAPPTAGQYTMKLYAVDAASETTERAYKYAGAYTINCSSPKPDVAPLPVIDRLEWGPGHDLARVGLTALTHTEGHVEVNAGETQLRFKAEKDVQIMAKLHSNSKEASELRQYVVTSQVDGEVIVTVKLPDSGEYALDLYAKDDTTEGHFENTCSYLLTADAPAADPTPFPEFGEGVCVGVLREAQEYHVEAISHSQAFVEASSSGELGMTFKAESCEITTELVLQTMATHQVVQDHVMLRQDASGEISLNARFPEPGLYALKVYARSQDADGETRTNVHNYVVNVPELEENCLPFPEVFQEWSGVVDKDILEPRDGMLPPSQSVKFAIKLPTAFKVATFGSKSGWTYLTREEDGVWSGDVATGETGDEIQLRAVFEEESNEYSTLLSYFVTDEIAEGNLEVDADDDVDVDSTADPDTEEDQVVLPQFTDDFQPFTEFPEPVLLKRANDVYTTYEKPVPHDDDGTVAAYPCPTWKEDVFKLAEFAELDAHAVETPAKLSIGSMADLVKYLVHPPSKVPQSAGSGTMSDLAIARVLFRWITAQNLNELNFIAKIQQETPLWHLRKISQDTGDYTTLFAAMCRAAGLKVKELRGHVKGVNYKLSDGISPEGTSTWAAILIDDVWRLVDVNWGARHMVGGGTGEWVLVDNTGMQDTKSQPVGPAATKYACDESYFITDPYQFIYSHIPDESESWQLLARSVTFGEFGELAYLKPPFFDMGLRIISDRRFKMFSDEGEAELIIGLPETGEKRRFFYKMWQWRGDDANSSNVDKEFTRYVFMQQVDGELRCTVYFPKAGKYKLELFVQDTEHNADSQSYSLACAYIIHCSSPKKDCVPMPDIQRKEWGPGSDVARLGLTALTHKDGLIEVENGEAVIRFKADKDVRILAKLNSNSKDAVEISNYVVHHQETGEIVIHVKLPDSGEYALNLFGKEASEKGSYQGVCSYLLRADAAAFDKTSYPEIANGELGPTDKAANLHFKAISHPAGYLEEPPAGQLDMTFQADPCEMVVKLIRQTPDGPREVENQLMYGQRSTGEIFVNARFPETGMYALTIFAKRRGDKGKFQAVYTYVIKVTSPMENCVEFPAVTSAWSGGVDNEILEPLGGTLLARQTVDFAIKMPKAIDVAVIGSNNWTHLKNDGNGVWRASVETGEGGRQLKLSAKTEKKGNNYATLLSYTVVSNDDLEELMEKQNEDAAEAEKRRAEEEEMRKQRERDFEDTKQGLLRAIEKQNIELLRDAIKAVENKGYITRLQREYDQAKKLLKSLMRIEALRHAVMDLDMKTMAEIRSYSRPPKMVHDVMRASLLLLGDHEGKTKKWQKCQRRCKTIGPQGLLSRVRKFNLEKVHPEIAARSKEILQHFRLDDVRERSAGAAAFYIWVVGMAEELTVLKGVDETVTPANFTRQKEILPA